MVKFRAGTAAIMTTPFAMSIFMCECVARRAGNCNANRQPRRSQEQTATLPGANRDAPRSKPRRSQEQTATRPGANRDAPRSRNGHRRADTPRRCLCAAPARAPAVSPSTRDAQCEVAHGATRSSIHGYMSSQAHTLRPRAGLSPPVACRVSLCAGADTQAAELRLQCARLSIARA
jgi:hypothetical protein